MCTLNEVNQACSFQIEVVSVWVVWVGEVKQISAPSTVSIREPERFQSTSGQDQEDSFAEEGCRIYDRKSSLQVHSMDNQQPPHHFQPCCNTQGSFPWHRPVNEVMMMAVLLQTSASTGVTSEWAEPLWSNTSFLLLLNQTLKHDFQIELLFPYVQSPFWTNIF